jgi:prepilin-type N-terminal cleavage/methylation domain-containing protein
MTRSTRKIKEVNSTKGFTIVELMIASTVFAVVLVIAQAGFVQIGHLFYRGVSITSTQAIADHIFQYINGNFQNAPGVHGPNSSGPYSYYCIGNSRYTFNINKEIDTGTASDPSTGNYGILKDTLQGSGDECAAPCSDTSCPAPFNNPVEQLGDKMRLEQLNIGQSTSTSNLYNVAIVVAYGDDDTLTYDYSVPLPDRYKTVSCKSDAHNSFCAVSRINTAVYKGIHQQ